ncbi:MAPEG family protein [Pelagibacteraceae bacterium]|nr:MAPEG family protein [Pelagibacteraceae bacterium]
MQQISILLPVITLAFWTFIIFAIMAPARFYFLRMKHPQTAAHTKNLKGLLPPWTERVADNYNHLFEQPVVFYAIALSIAVINNIEPLMIQLAWVYVALRVLHSIVQITFNFVPLRFSLFVTSWLILGYMIACIIVNS